MAMNIKQEEINILDSRVYADATHKNDNKKESSLGDTPSLSSLSGGSSSELSLGDTPSLSSLGKSRRDATRGSINNDINILDSRVFADATHKNDSRMSESGRSMVEILGVLVIIGVLSIGGIMGYNYAIAKNKANEITSELNLRAIVLSQQQTQSPKPAETTLTMEMGNTMKFGNEVSAEVSVNPEYFEITVADVEKQACELILQDYTTSAWMIINGTLYENTPTVCDTDKNTMTFVYKNDLGEKRNCAQKGFFNLDSYKCECAGGTYFDNTAKDCVCPAGHVWSDTERKCIESRCGDNEFEALDGGCVSCEDPKVYLIETNNDVKSLCNACPNRRVYNDKCAIKCPTGTIFSGNKCVDCADANSPSISLMENKDECLACSESRVIARQCVLKKRCPDGQFSAFTSWYGCFSCTKTLDDRIQDILTQFEIDQCNSCVDANGQQIRTVINNRCEKTLCDTTEFKGQDGICYACTHPNSVLVDDTSDCESKCLNRKIVDGYCKINNCSNGVLLSDGTCYPCDTTRRFEATEEECASCGTRTDGTPQRVWMSVKGNGYCRINNCALGVSIPYHGDDAPTLCYTCNLTENTSLYGGAMIIGVSDYMRDSCEACGNYWTDSGHCYDSDACNRGREFRNKLNYANICTSCDYSGKVLMENHEEHRKMCADCVSTPRFFAEDYCYRCDSNEEPVVTTSEERASCTKCPNRQINAEGKCELIKTEE